MSIPSPLHWAPSRTRGIILAAGLSFAAFPAYAQGAPVLLGSAAPFAVLGGSAVTNTGPSILNGDLGVAPGTSLTGFASPAVVNGATHSADAVAAQAQASLTTAYDVAAAEPGTDLTGQNLGGMTLTAGSYRFSSSAQLTGMLTLDAQGDPNAQFVFGVGSTLTTASASSVVLINGGSACNVFWQVGSSATLGTTTAFQGNVMALTSITLNNRAAVVGRVLARNGQVTLDDNLVDASSCTTGSAPTPTPTPGPGTTPVPGIPAPIPSPASTTGPAGAQRVPTPLPAGEGRLERTGPPSTCGDGFRAVVRGRNIASVRFRLDGKRVAGTTKAPFSVEIAALPGRHRVTARMTFTTGAPAMTAAVRYRACDQAMLRPLRGPATFTG